MASGLVGASIAGYSIEGIAGRGGMGVVYRARDHALNRVVALKVIAPEFARDSKFRSRFMRETLATAALDHPNVIPVYAADEDPEGQLYIAMRFVEGEDLGALLHRSGALEPGMAAELVAQAASALDAAHARGLVHRDVKPGNVLLARGSRAHVYLTDFGLVKWDETTTGSLTTTGGWLGTPDYVAPEQVDGGSADARTDVYALGCVLYAALTGRPPFAEVPRLKKAGAHLNEPVPSLRATAPGVPAAFDRVIRRALAKSPADRYQTAGELGDAALAAAGPSAPGKTARTARTRRLGRRPATPVPTARLSSREPRRGLILGAGAAGLLGVAVAIAALAGAFSGGGSGHHSRHRPKPPPPASASNGTVRCGPTRCAQHGVRVQAPIEDGSCSGPSGAGVWTRIDAEGEPLFACMVDSGVVRGSASLMPDVIRGRLDLTQNYLEGLGLSHQTEGGGVLRGIIDDSNWHVCGTAPAAGTGVTPGEKVKLFVARSC